MDRPDRYRTIYRLMEKHDGDSLVQERAGMSELLDLGVEIPAAVEHSVISQCRRELLHQSPLGLVRFDFPAMQNAIVQLWRTGETALVAEWYRPIRNTFMTEAVTVCLTGIDACDDAIALKEFGDTLTAECGADEEAVDHCMQLVSSSRPVAVHLFRDECGSENVLLRACMGQLAASFFSQFGLSGTSRDRRRV